MSENQKKGLKSLLISSAITALFYWFVFKLFAPKPVTIISDDGTELDAYALGEGDEVKCVAAKNKGGGSNLLRTLSLCLCAIDMVVVLTRLLMRIPDKKEKAE